MSSDDTSRLLRLWEIKKYIKQYSNNKFSISFNPLYVWVNFDNKFTALTPLI